MPVEYFAALVCAWLASYLAHSTVLLATAWFVTRRLPPTCDRLAELVWRLALGVPVLSALGQQLTLFGQRAATPATALEYAPAALTVGAVPNVVWLLVAVAWIVGAAIGLAQLRWLYRSLRMSIRHRTLVRREQLHLGKLRGTRSTRVSIVEGLSVPLALVNEICLPGWVVDGMDEEELRAVVAHELAHLRRRDAIWRALVAVVTRVFFFQPLNWLASARLRELSECICDEQAIEATRSTVALASALRAVAERSTSRRVNLSLVPAMGYGKSFALRRVLRILSSSDVTPRHTPTRGLAAIAIAFGAAAFFLAPRVTLPGTAFIRYTINAEDPAGAFTLTVEKGRVTGATISGRTLDKRQVIQRDRTVRIVDPRSGAFSLQLTPSGGVRWNPRKSGS